MANAILDDDDTEEYALSFESNIEDAERPEPLPEGEYKGAEVVDFRATTNNSGKPQVQLDIIIPPTVFPIDFNPENAPDGARVRYYSPDLSDSKMGRYNAKKLATAFKLGSIVGFKSSQFVGKKVKVKVRHYQTPDGPTAVLDGMPEAL